MKQTIAYRNFSVYRYHVKQLAVRAGFAILEKAAAFIALAIALVIVIKADKNKQPKPIKQKERIRNAV